jgi:hypothetical protein
MSAVGVVEVQAGRIILKRVLGFLAVVVVVVLRRVHTEITSHVAPPH